MSTIESILELTNCKNLQELEDWVSSQVIKKDDPMLALYNECVHETEQILRNRHLELSYGT